MFKHGILYDMNGGVFFHTEGEQERSWPWCKISVLQAMDELSKEEWQVVCSVSKSMADEAYIMRKQAEHEG